MRLTEKKKLPCDGCGKEITITVTNLKDKDGWALVPIDDQVKKKGWKLVKTKDKDALGGFVRRAYCSFCRDLN